MRNLHYSQSYLPIARLLKRAIISTAPEDACGFAPQRRPFSIARSVNRRPMNLIQILTITMFLLLIGATNVPPTTRPVTALTVRPPTSRPATFEDNYLLILQRNIFSRTRTYSYSSSSYVPSTQSSYTPQSSYVLRGVMESEGGGPLIAFIENLRTGETMRSRQGDVVAGGKIGRIEINSIEYAMGAKPVRIDIGMSLGGTAPTTQSSYASGPTTGPSSTSGSSDASGGGSSDILERLRQRRLQELKK